MTTPAKRQNTNMVTVKPSDLQFIKQPQVGVPTGLGACKNKDQEVQ